MNVAVANWSQVFESDVGPASISSTASTPSSLQTICHSDSRFVPVASRNFHTTIWVKNSNSFGPHNVLEHSHSRISQYLNADTTSRYINERCVCEE